MSCKEMRQPVHTLDQYHGCGDVQAGLLGPCEACGPNAASGFRKSAKPISQVRKAASQLYDQGRPELSSQVQKG